MIAHPSLPANLRNRTAFETDKHIQNLILFHPQAPLRDEKIYTNGWLILQDKASCMPAVVLNPPASDDTVVIDATAAPGNKTSHLSALMKNRGKLLAFERDRKRFGTLEMMLEKAKCTNVKSLNADFLMSDPLDPAYAKVTHMSVFLLCPHNEY
jgi:putative methyltransferase